MSNYTKITKEELLNLIKGNEYENSVNYAYIDLGVREGLIDFLNDDHIQVEGAFSANEKLYVVYSKIATPMRLKPLREKESLLN